MNLVSETYQEFKQGGDPYKKLGVGKWKNSCIIRKLLEENALSNQIEIEIIYDWLKSNQLSKEVGVNSINDVKHILSFDLNNEFEKLEVEGKLFRQLEKEHDNFMVYYYQGGKAGTLKYYRGTLKDGSIAIYYQGGLIDGYITRKDWLS